MTWMLRAECRGLDSDTMFPSATPGRSRKPSAEESVALSFCETCPVRNECLEFALEHWEIGKWGVWGGLTEHDRAVLAGKRRVRA